MILTTRLLILSVLSRCLGLQVYVVDINGTQTAAVRHVSTVKPVAPVDLDANTKPLEDAELPPLKTVRGNKS